jgi:hypothetical protein
MAKNSDFDFETFTVQAIQVIDEIRSYGKDSSTPIEPRINAFYRAIGLPVAIIEDTKQQDANNGNIFSANIIDYQENSVSFNIRRFSFKKSILPEEISDFLKFNQNKLSDGIKDLSDKDHRIRGVLFPMIVDGEIPIFPQEKRMADAFKTDEGLIAGTVKYRRPLIEAIVLMRLKIEGAHNAVLQSKVNQDFGTALKDLDKFSKLIYTSLVNNTDGLDELLSKTINKASNAIKNTNISLAPIVANIAQQSLARVEPQDQTIGEMDRKLFLQNERLQTQQAIITALEFDDTFGGDVKNSRNVKDAIFVSNLMSMINSGLTQESKIKKDNRDTNTKREKYVSDIKETFRTLDLLLGTFGSISGVDIMVVISALFNIELNALYGLLNNNAILNLEKIKGKGIAKNKLSVNESISILQKEVLDLYTKIESNVSQTKHSNKRSLQQEENGEV